MRRFFFAVIIFLAFILLVTSSVKADQYDDVTRELEALKKELSGKEANYQKLNSQLNDIKNKINFLEAEINKKTIEVKKGEEVLIYQKTLLNERAKNYYKNSGKNPSSLINLLIADNFSQSLQNFFYQKKLVDEDKQAIIKIVMYIKKLEDMRAELETETKQLALLKIDVDKQATILNGEIATTRNRVAELSAQQQQLLAQKLASLNISRSAASMGRCDSDLTNGRDPGFSPKFAFFTFGVPNRVGLNQYGAKGRASFQGHEDILRAYFNDISFETRSNVQIKVQDHGEMPLETYLLGVCEMPESWPMEALKAQVVAARSYALAYTNNGANEICTTESCQVYCGEKTGQWKTAVEETAGKVMVQGGNPIKAWYSSTHGGYVFSSGDIGWSGTSWTKHANDFSGSVNSFDDLKNNAYDKESPWFYCDWGSRSDYNKTAWLKPNELADIVNVIELVKNDASTGEHLYQVDNPPSGKDVWGAEKVKSVMKDKGITPLNSVNDMNIGADFGSGKSNSIHVSGDTASYDNIGADEFKNWFNLRAPANIQIVGPLYNVEKR
jgi:peptidoglycan hydrolase-like amidase